MLRVGIDMMPGQKVESAKPYTSTTGRDHYSTSGFSSARLWHHGINVQTKNSQSWIKNLYGYVFRIISIQNQLRGSIKEVLVP